MWWCCSRSLHHVSDLGNSWWILANFLFFGCSCYLKVARCGLAGESWMSSSLFKNVCVLRWCFIILFRPFLLVTVSLSVQGLRHQETEDNWTEPLLIVGLSLQKCVCSDEVLFMPIAIAFFTWLKLRNAGGLWSSRWVHHVSLSVQGLPPKKLKITESNFY